MIAMNLMGRQAADAVHYFSLFTLHEHAAELNRLVR